MSKLQITCCCNIRLTKDIGGIHIFEFNLKKNTTTPRAMTTTKDPGAGQHNIYIRKEKEKINGPKWGDKVAISHREQSNDRPVHELGAVAA